MKDMQAGIRYTATANKPPEDQDYPVAAGLAEAIIAQAMEDEIDVTASMEAPSGPRGSGIGHAVGFIYRRILKDKPIPLVPVLLNTYYPPNQAKPGRCFEFGRSIGRAIRAWDGGKRVAVCASGGLSHFVVDEEWDQKMIDALLKQDVETIANEPNIMFRSGTSETKNWITAAGAVSDTGLQMKMLDYVPCYRTPAGTGSGMGFATWT
jgi:OH-DDVA oxygenase/3-O-methylgallate 3,4-dioxygenase